MEERTLRTLHPTLVREDLISPEQQLRWITRQLRELREANAALTARVQQLEEAFHGRIEFLASDGTDPYVPAAETEPVTEAPTTEVTEETSAPTAEETTQETTEETTLPVTEETLPPTTVPAEAETTLPETTVPTENPPAEAPSRYSPVTLILAAVVMVLCILAAGVLIIRSHRGGNYLD